MKNLKKLTKKQLKTIDGGVGVLCPPPATTCAEWATWTPRQQQICQNWILDENPC
ncbi:hypothetical protein AB4Y90_10845 [Chryseobacterium sp. 2TAF14]|uniref:bacteriocin-like protein n=1 Tax=Chryseobacterium sp. 2TAF14 TaxID=3233007 RepID=UPI003F90A088